MTADKHALFDKAKLSSFVISRLQLYLNQTSSREKRGNLAQWWHHSFQDFHIQNSNTFLLNGLVTQKWIKAALSQKSDFYVQCNFLQIPWIGWSPSWQLDFSLCNCVAATAATKENSTVRLILWDCKEELLPGATTQQGFLKKETLLCKGLLSW